jgi:hypothetical protein
MIMMYLFSSMAEHDFSEDGSVANHIAFQLIFSSVSDFPKGLWTVLTCSALLRPRFVVEFSQEGVRR